MEGLKAMKKEEQLASSAMEKLLQGKVRNNLLHNRALPRKKEDLLYEETQYQKLLSSRNGFFINDIGENINYG